MKFSDNMKKARELLNSGDYTLVLYNGNEVLTKKERGIKPLMDLYNDKASYVGFLAADKVIGKAAAFMYALLGITEVYADVVSERALDVFKSFDINIEYGKCVSAIENRTKTGYCPMETAVWDIDNPEQALIAIKNTLNKLKKPSE